MRERKHLQLTLNQDETIYTPDTSTIILPLSVALSDLQSLANEKMRTTLFHGPLAVNKGKDTVFISIRRTGGLVFSMVNNKLSAVVPLEAEAIYMNHLIGNINKSFYSAEPFTVQVDATLETPVTITSTYGLQAKTNLKSLNWKKPPVIHTRLVNIDLTDRINALVFQNEKAITHKIDSTIDARISLRKTMSDVWHKMQRPVRLGKPELQFYLTNQAVHLGIWQGPQNGDSLNLLLKLSSLMRVVNGGDTALYAASDLPDSMFIARTEPPDDTSRICVNMMIPLTAIEAYSNKQLSGKILEQTGHHINIQSVKIQNGKENIFVSIKCGGDVSGELKLKGQPLFDIKNRRLTICNLEYESNAGDFLNSVDNVFHDLVLQELQSSVNLDMEHVMDTIPILIRNGIAKSKFAQKADAFVTDFTVSTVQPHLTKKYIQLIVKGSANVSMHLKKAAMIKRDSA